MFVPKSANPKDHANEFHGVMEPNIPSSVHWVDLTKPNTFVAMSQPSAQSCAVLGGIMALRMKRCEAKGIIVGGRIRDLSELKTMHIPVRMMRPPWFDEVMKLILVPDLGLRDFHRRRWVRVKSMGC